MKSLTIIGAVLVILGLLGFAVPMFTTKETKDVAKIGSLNVQTTEDTPHSIPPLLAGGVLAVGVVLLGLGVSQKR